MKKVLKILMCQVLMIPFLSNAQQGLNLENVKKIVEAVNMKDATLYVKNFHTDIKVFLYEDQEFKLKVSGSQALFKNRAAHFKKHPKVRNIIKHLVEIDEKVIIHDRVWLSPDVPEGSDIVEIYTFDGAGKIVRVDVIQQKNLFAKEGG